METQENTNQTTDHCVISTHRLDLNRDERFGLIGKITTKQTNRIHFSDIEIGEKFVIINGVNLPAYDALAVFPFFKPQILENGENHYTGYLERNTYKIIGSIFDDAKILFEV